MGKRKYYQPEIETMPVEEIKKLQSEKLVKQVAHVYANVPAYREMIEAVYGAGSCYVLKVRADGAIKVTL